MTDVVRDDTKAEPGMGLEGGHVRRPGTLRQARGGSPAFDSMPPQHVSPRAVVEVVFASRFLPRRQRSIVLSSKHRSQHTPRPSEDGAARHEMLNSCLNEHYAQSAAGLRASRAFESAKLTPTGPHGMTGH